MNARETVVITGANRGIGLALVARLLADGKCVIGACREPANAHALASLAERHAGALRIAALDVTCADSVARFAGSLSGEPVDVLVNGAGVSGGERQTLTQMDYSEWLETLATNTLAPFRVSLALLPNLRRAARPRIVTLSSQMGSLQRKSLGAFAYRSSKAAVNKVMQVLALELAAERVVVCPVHPGWVRTDMGGPRADISPEESAAGLAALIERLTLAESGRFWTWDGREHPW